jgi:magnesium-transporting ATPase (P-type)
LALYNVLFTLLPVIIVGFFDRDVSDRMALRYTHTHTHPALPRRAVPNVIAATAQRVLSLLTHHRCASLRYPGLYATSRQRTQFNILVFLGWLVNSVFHSVVVVVVIALIHDQGIGDATGKNQGLWCVNGLSPRASAEHMMLTVTGRTHRYMGSLSYTAVLLLVTAKLALEIRSWTYLHHLGTPSLCSPSSPGRGGHVDDG